jgi:hypothetical protein
VGTLGGRDSLGNTMARSYSTLVSQKNSINPIIMTTVQKLALFFNVIGTVLAFFSLTVLYYVVNYVITHW